MSQHDGLPCVGLPASAVTAMWLRTVRRCKPTSPAPLPAPLSCSVGSYTAGIAAPILLTILRLFQGLAMVRQCKAGQHPQAMGGHVQGRLVPALPWSCGREVPACLICPTVNPLLPPPWAGRRVWQRHHLHLVSWCQRGMQSFCPALVRGCTFPEASSARLPTPCTPAHPAPPPRELAPVARRGRLVAVLQMTVK